MSGAHDVQQPDITLTGNFGITGQKGVSRFTNFYGHQIIPHVTVGGNLFIMLAAILQAEAVIMLVVVWQESEWHPRVQAAPVVLPLALLTAAQTLRKCFIVLDATCLA